MKTIKFRPLRRDKNGRIIVADYMQWRKVYTSDYSGCELTLIKDYDLMNPDEPVYNHKGDRLFFYGFIPDASVEYSYFKTNTHYLHLDCDGIPAFTHATMDRIANWDLVFFDNHAAAFEPLTVKMVMDWFGNFLFKLNKTTLITTP